MTLTTALAVLLLALLVATVLAVVTYRVRAYHLGRMFVVATTAAVVAVAPALLA